jgi:hypothetical protein
MKEIILNFLATKSSREFHPLNLLIKGNANVKTREGVQQVKATLRGMKELEFQGLDQLDGINNDGHNPSFPDGRARPTQYFNFDTVNVSARGLKDVAPKPAPLPGKAPVLTPQQIHDAAFPPKKPVTVLPKPAPLPVVTGHPLDIPEEDDKDRAAHNKILQDSLINGGLSREELSQQLGRRQMD